MYYRKLRANLEASAVEADNSVNEVVIISDPHMKSNTSKTIAKSRGINPPIPEQLVSDSEEFSIVHECLKEEANSKEDVLILDTQETFPELEAEENSLPVGISAGSGENPIQTIAEERPLRKPRGPKSSRRMHHWIPGSQPPISKYSGAAPPLKQLSDKFDDYCRICDGLHIMRRPVARRQKSLEGSSDRKL